jgi:hypothetical protein
VIEVKPDAASATADGAATASGSTPAGTKKTQDGKHKQGSQR